MDTTRLRSPDCDYSTRLEAADTIDRLTGERDRQYQQNAAQIVRIAEMEVTLAACVDALERAERFIKSGIELGYIRMPELEINDPVWQTLPAISRALAAAAGDGGEDGP